jgi:hypothetical protein
MTENISSECKACNEDESEQEDLQDLFDQLLSDAQNYNLRQKSKSKKQKQKAKKQVKDSLPATLAF